MKANTTWTVAVIIVVAIVGGILIWQYNSSQPAPVSSVPGQSAGATSTMPAGFQSLTLAGGDISVRFPSGVFALATASETVAVQSVIPPCDQGFEYCIYAVPGTYSGTNFEGAGLRIQMRPDLTTQDECLDTPPDGFSPSAETPATTSTNSYSASTFGNVGGGAAGSLSEASLYRIFVPASSHCYEFETRIANSEFANYPSGTIQEFTDADRGAMLDSLNGILSTLSLTLNGVAIILPAPTQ